MNMLIMLYFEDDRIGLDLILIYVYICFLDTMPGQAYTRTPIT